MTSFFSHPLVAPNLVELRTYQSDIAKEALNQNSLVILPTGLGKCHGKGTKILLFDGSIKNVEDIEVGDRLMGPDSTPRNVLSLSRGIDEMYEICPVKGETWTCNQSHILSLRATANDGRIKKDSVTNISIRDYLEKSKTFKHLMKLYRVEVSFPKDLVQFDPYILGVWLGDGSKHSPQITNSDFEIQEALLKFSKKYGLNIRKVDGHNTIEHNLSYGSKNRGRYKKKNPLLEITKICFMNGEKRIPREYLLNDENVRLDVLAGLLDTDGYLIDGVYEIITKYQGLSDDILFLARSLGFYASSRSKIGSIKQTGFKGVYHRIFISGDVSRIPCKVERKIAKPRTQKKNVLNTGFSIRSIGVGDYYGFEIDGDHLYLLGDFTVTHNTSVSLMVMAERLTGSQKVILVAPTKPLCEQHYQNFERYLPYTAVRLLTGELPSHERLKEWNDAQVIIATPQTIENDLKTQTYTLKDVSLLVIDEAHRAVGGYAYTFIAGEYYSTSQRPLILAMTASPGGDEEKVNQIKDALFIDKVISKSEDDEDVKPYLHEKEIIKLYFDLPDLLKRSSQGFKEIIKSRCKALNEMGIKISSSPTQTQLNQLNHQFTVLIAQKDGTGYEFARIYGEIMKLRHAVKVAETQGLIPLRKYLNDIFTEGMKAGAKGASKRLVQEESLQQIHDEVGNAGSDEIHPKMIRLSSLVEIQLKKDPNMKILIFAEFRDTVSLIASQLKARDIAASTFTGQSKKGEEKGMNQKKQVEVLNKFRSGEIRVLVSTSVGEEGLDIPSCDLVILYEPVPSEVRSIQRRGRTGRFATGNVLIMITKGTQDEINYYTSQRKEQAMKIMDHTTRQVKIGVEG